MGSDKITVRCISCGAEFDHLEPRCPYCGTMYEPGAEKQYMETLGDIREDMEELNSLALSETASELKSAAKKTILAVIIVIAAGVVLFGLSFLINML